MNITFKHKGEVYNLEFDLDTIKRMANAGMTSDYISNNAEVCLDELFFYALAKHHKYVNRRDAKEMLAKITNKEQFFISLFELYRAPIEALLEEPEEGAEGNISWEINR